MPKTMLKNGKTRMLKYKASELISKIDNNCYTSIITEENNNSKEIYKDYKRNRKKCPNQNFFFDKDIMFQIIKIKNSTNQCFLVNNNNYIKAIKRILKKYEDFEVYIKEYECENMENLKNYIKNKNLEINILKNEKIVSAFNDNIVKEILDYLKIHFLKAFSDKGAKHFYTAKEIINIIKDNKEYLSDENGVLDIKKVTKKIIHINDYCLEEKEEFNIKKFDKNIVEKLEKSELYFAFKFINTDDLFKSYETKLIITPTKKQKEEKIKIPKKIREDVWDEHIGQSIGKAKCYCCKSRDIRQSDFDCGHIIAESKNGGINIENLRPICKRCNSDMGSMNMNDFIEKYYSD